MHISNQIDQLIQKLNSLKPILSDNKFEDQEKFEDVLRASLESTEEKNLGLTSTPVKGQNKGAQIPNWVDPDYAYDANSPRKPNMREMMEALSGKSVEDLYADESSDWQELSALASEMLYGVTGSTEDTRDWSSIMSSKNILHTAREHTGEMLDPKVGIISKYDDDNVLKEQVATIKDKKGNALRLLPRDVTSAEEILRNYGAMGNAIPTNLDDQIDPNIFDNNLLTFLKGFDKKPDSIEQIAVQSASEAIAKKLSQEIPLDELAKL